MLVMGRVFDIRIPLNVYAIKPIILVIYLFGLAYIGIIRLPVFTDFNRFIQLAYGPESSHTVKERYSKSRLQDSEAQALVDRLEEVMKKNKPYLDDTIDLKSLAESMNCSPHKLSQVLNEKIGSSFFELINEYRIEEVKKRFSDPENRQFTLMAIAYDCGFSSKSAFYSSFKKYLGMTPGAYLKLNKTG